MKKIKNETKSNNERNTKNKWNNERKWYALWIYDCIRKKCKRKYEWWKIKQLSTIATRTKCKIIRTEYSVDVCSYRLLLFEKLAQKRRKAKTLHETEENNIFQYVFMLLLNEVRKKVFEKKVSIPWRHSVHHLDDELVLWYLCFFCLLRWWFCS